MAIWRRPRLTARGDPDHDQVVAQIVARLLELPRGSVVLAEDETHLNLLPHLRASWTLRGRRPEVPTPGKNRQATVFGALKLTTGVWVYRLGRRCAADFITLLDQLLIALPSAPVILLGVLLVVGVSFTWFTCSRNACHSDRRRCPGSQCIGGLGLGGSSWSCSSSGCGRGSGPPQTPSRSLRDR